MNSHFRSKLNDRCFTLESFREAPDSRGRGGRGVHPIMVYSGQVLPERGSFSVYERVGILLVELLIFLVCKKAQKGQQTHLMSFTWL